jgi:hypothetical protein
MWKYIIYKKLEIDLYVNWIDRSSVYRHNYVTLYETK